MAFSKGFLLTLVLVSIAATCVEGSTATSKAGTSSVTDSPEHKALTFRIPFVPGVVTKASFGRHLTQTNTTTCPANYKTCPPYTATVLNCVPTVFTCCPLPVGGSCPPGFTCQLYNNAVPYCYSAASMLQSQIVMIVSALAVALFMMFSTSERV